MTFITANGCQIYFESFGKEKVHQPPIVLVHGSTRTGHSCWYLAAQLLTQKYHVIVPDCRGHGQSQNPGMSYSFQEMASDIANLVKSLGYSKAHIIGHSNGGNVALVTLMLHPDIVQSAVLQAANAFVSQDLIDKEPAIFDPERVAEEDPDWMDEMIRLHGPTHGNEYWRDLLKMTVEEIIREPNFTPADLSQVERPVLVIQGENDRVNAPARHGQFIAKHIPYAQLWIPHKIGHNVHDEILFNWIEHVFTFLSERGNEINDRLYRYKQDHYPDGRITVFNPRFDTNASIEPGAPLLLDGEVLTQEQSQAAENVVIISNNNKIDNQIRILSRDADFAIAHRTVSDIRKGPSIRSERVSQLLLGESVVILETQNGWSKVQMEMDSYIGWVQSNSLTIKSKDDLHRYQESCTARVCVDLLPAYLFNYYPSNYAESVELTAKLPFGVRVLIEDILDEKAILLLPNNVRWIVDRNGLLDDAALPMRDEDGINLAIQYIRKFIGVPYLWGGRTPFGYDCSGLAQTFLNFVNIHVPRDADQQFRIGSSIESDPIPGDLLFFGEQDGPNTSRFENISHVAISLGGAELIHANGTAWGVSINSLNPDSPNYQPWLRENLVGIRRFR